MWCSSGSFNNAMPFMRGLPLLNKNSLEVTEVSILCVI